MSRLPLQDPLSLLPQDIRPSIPTVELRRPRRRAPQISPEEEASLLSQIGAGTASGFSMLGNLLDLPGSMFRDVASSVATGELQNPFDQLLSPTTGENRVSGRDLITQFGIAEPNKETGIMGWLDDPREAFRDIGGFAAEVALDPFFFAPTKSLAALKGIGVNPVTRPVGKYLGSTRIGEPIVEGTKAAGRQLGAMFDRSVRGATTPGGRIAGRAATSAEREAGVRSRELWAPHIEQGHRLFEKLPDTPSRLKAHDDLAAAIEGVRPLPPELADLQPTVDFARKRMEELIPEERAAGLVSRDVDDIYVDYLPRRAIRFPGDKSKSQFPARLLSGKHASQKHRKDFLRDIQGGRSLINQLSVDPKLSGVVHKMQGQPGKSFWDAQEAALREAMEEAGAPNRLFEHSRELARWLGGLDPRHVDQQMPIFGHNPLDELLLREELSQRAQGLAHVLRDQVQQPGNLLAADDAAPGAVRLTDLLEGAGLDVDENLRLLGASNTDRVPKELAEDLGRVIKSFQAPEEVGKFLQASDAFTRLWKSSMVAFPAFHGRNLMSGQIANWLAGTYGKNPATWTRAFGNVQDLLAGKTVKGLQEIGGEFKGLSDEAATELFRQQAFADNVAPRGQGIGLEDVAGTSLDVNPAADIPGLVPNRLRDIPGQAIPRSLAEANPLNTAGVRTQTDVFAPFRASRQMGSWTEGMNRLTPYLALRRRGVPRAEAAARVRGIQVDYDDLADFERKVMRRIAPFYSFTRKQGEFLAKELMQNPGGPFGQTIRAQRIAAEDDRPLPEHIGETGPIPLGETPGGGERFITGLGLMHEDPLSYLGGGPQKALTEALSRTHPIPKWVLESVTGESFFQRGPMGGRDLLDMDPPIGRLISNVGEMAERVGLREPQPDARPEPFISPGVEHFLSNMPTSRFVSTLRTLTDPRKTLGETIVPQESLLNTLTGLRITDLSPGARDRAISETVDAIMRDDLGGGLFTNVYIPQEEIEETRKTDPERAARMEAATQISRLKQQQRRQRKRERELEEQRANWTQTAP